MSVDVISAMDACKVAINTLRPWQNGRRFADDTFKRIFLNENVRISIKISLKFVPKGPIDNNPALVQIMAWRRSGDKPLSEPMIVYWRIYASLGLNELTRYYSRNNNKNCIDKNSISLLPIRLFYTARPNGLRWQCKLVIWSQIISGSIRLIHLLKIKSIHIVFLLAK